MRCISVTGYFLLLLLSAACSSQQRSVVPEVVRVRWPRDPESLNPVTLPNAYAVQASNLLYQSLLVVDGPNRRFVPWLATALPSVERADSLSLLSYQIRPEATWDNGQPILARDVLFTLKVLNCPGLPNESQRNVVSFIEDVRLDSADPRRFTLVCRGYAPEYRTSSGDFFILPEYLLDPDTLLRPLSLPTIKRAGVAVEQPKAVRAFQERFNQATQWRDPRVVRGSGPYELVSWQSGQRLVLGRKKNWWADRLTQRPASLVANPQRLEFHVVPDPATAVLALRRGELDVYPNATAADFAKLRTSGAEQFNFFAPPSYHFVVLELNTQQPTLRDPLTRQAFGRLLNVPLLLRATQYGQGQRSTSLISPLERWVYHDSLPLLTYAPAQAAALLRQAGWQRTAAGWTRPTAAGAQTLQPRLFYAVGDRTYETIALQLQQAARAIGVPVSLHPTEASALSELRREGRFDIGLRTLYGTPLSYDLRPLLHTSSVGEGGINRTRFGNAASDRLLESIATTEDSVRKARLLRKLQTLLYQEAPMLPLYFEPNRLIVAKRFANVRPSGIDPGYDVASFTLADAARR